MYLFDEMIDFDDDEEDQKPFSRHHIAPDPTQLDYSWMGLFEEELNIATKSSEDEGPKPKQRRGSNQSYGSKQSYGSNQSHERAFLAALASIDDRSRKTNWGDGQTEEGDSLAVLIPLGEHPSMHDGCTCGCLDSQ
jgi:hypothetical protein